MKPLPDFPAVLQAFFTDRLGHQLQASSHTVASYRDTMKLLLKFASSRTAKAPSQLSFSEIDATLINGFLEHLERVRSNSPRTRNARLAAIHSLFQFAALEVPQHAASIQRVLSIPHKRFNRPAIDYLQRDEIDALLSAPDRSTWIGRRDHAMLLIAIESGLRASELVGLSARDANLARGPSLRCWGKGRKERCVPLSRAAVAVLRDWARETGAVGEAPLFPSVSGARLGRDGLEYALRKHVRRAAAECRSLGAKRVSAHVLRHTSAMTLLHAGVDRAVIALWLGHESADTTQVYLHGDLETKRRALARSSSPGPRRKRFVAGDRLITFLENL